MKGARKQNIRSLTRFTEDGLHRSYSEYRDVGVRGALPADCKQEFEQIPADHPLGQSVEVSLRQVDKTFRSPLGDIQALRSINLDIRAGEFLSIVGPSGCGKSSLLKCIAGLERPSSGDIRIRGQSISGPPDDLGMVFQRDVLLDWRTVLDNVLLPREFLGGDLKACTARAKHLLRLFGLEDFLHRYPWELSGGMRQRVAISRALLHDPALLLMDEPFGALDAFTRDELNLELQRIWEESKKTVVFVTHSIPEAIFLADRIVMMKRAPGEIMGVVDIDIPRSRQLAIRETPPFMAHAAHIREMFEWAGAYAR